MVIFKPAKVAKLFHLRQFIGIFSIQKNIREHYKKKSQIRTVFKIKIIKLRTALKIEIKNNSSLKSLKT